VYNKTVKLHTCTIKNEFNKYTILSPLEEK